MLRPFRYLDTTGKLPLLVATGTEGADVPQVRRHTAKASDRTVDCTICQPPVSWPLSEFMMHTAFHILNSDITLDYPCGVCGLHNANQYSTDPSAVKGCATWLAGRRGFRLVERGFSFQRFTARWLANSTSHSRLRRTSTKPTPALTQCCSAPNAPTSPSRPVFFWKYAGSDPSKPKGMLAHWRLKHSQRYMPEVLKDQLKVSTQEQQEVLAVGKAPPKLRKRRKAGAPGPAAASDELLQCSDCSEDAADGGGTPLNSEAEGMEEG